MALTSDSSTTQIQDKYWALPIAGSLPNLDPTYTNPKPEEDSKIADRFNGIFIVADGVTRTANKDVYPDPSPAKIAAEIFVGEAHKAICSIKGSLLPQEALMFGAKQGNLAVNRLNKALFPDGKIDYGEKDLAGACSILTLISGQKLHYLYNGDCVAYIEDRKGQLTRITPSQTDRFRDWKDQAPESERDQSFTRRKVRNNPEHPGRYGVFTGEQVALDSRLLGSGTIDLRGAERVILTSDGLDELVNSRESINFGLPKTTLRTALEIEKHSGSRSDDKTLITLQVFGPLRD